MKLIDIKTGKEVIAGNTITDFRGEVATLVGSTPPHKPSSSGRVQVEEHESVREYFPSVFGLKFVTDTGAEL